jgi:16S rRNA (cytosine967-C5)-methyltransferase
MTPGARFQAAIELLDEIAHARSPADVVIGRWARGHRYAGGGDRRAIRDLVYGAIRHKRQVEWWVERCGATVNVRSVLIAVLCLIEHRDPAAVTAAFDGGRYAAAPLSDPECRLLEALAEGVLDDPAQPADVRANVPAWLMTRLEEAFGAETGPALDALAREAPVDLRVSTLKATRAEAAAVLAADGIEAAETLVSPLGLRLAGRVPLAASRAWRDGLVDLQDEGSQIVALIADARPGQQVVDYCAGAGGKALALAASMNNEGRIVACDTAASRLRRGRERLRRAGVGIVEEHVIGPDDAAWRLENAGRFERVLVDAPCSGSGAWRRSPDAKWRLTETELVALCDLQDRLLDEAAGLVAVEGRLIFATCSVLKCENEARIAAFLERDARFALVPVERICAEILSGAPVAVDGVLKLAPHRQGTDGFFAAILERRR